MKKINLIFVILSLGFINSFAATIQINDKYNLLDKKYITFKNKQDLNNEINKLFQSMVMRGYATSTITFQNGQIKIIPGRINKVILKDDSTSFAKLKRYLLGVNNLENQILNIADINKIVERYNSSPSNKAKVNIVDSKRKNYSDVIISNKHKVMIRPSLSLEYKKDLKTHIDKHSVDIGVSVDQVFGLNDSFSINYLPAHNSRVWKANYNLPIRSLTVNLNYERIKDSDGKYYRGKIDRMGIDANYELIKKPDLTLISTNSIKKEIKRQFIKNTRIVKDHLNEFKMGFDLQKYFVNDQNLFILSLAPNITYKRKEHRGSDLNNTSCLVSENNLNFFSGNYTLNAFLGYSRSARKGEKIFDNDCKHSNTITDFDGTPLIFDTSHVAYINNTLSFPFSYESLELSPFAEFAIGKDMEQDINLMGASAGFMLSAKHLNFGAKYSQFKRDDKAFSLKLDLFY